MSAPTVHAPRPPVVDASDTPLWEGRAFGGIVLAAFLLYGIGSAAADRPIGVTLVVVNSIAGCVRRVDRLPAGSIHRSQRRRRLRGGTSGRSSVARRRDHRRKWSYGQPETFVQTVEVDPSPVQFTGDVVVLTSPITASPADVFVLAATEVPHATVIGNPSFGEFSDAIDITAARVGGRRARPTCARRRRACGRSPCNAS